ERRLEHLNNDMFTSRDRSRWSTLLKDLHGGQPEREAAAKDCTFLEAVPEINRLVTWGILNPLGPTVGSLCLVADPSGKVEVVFVKTSNPFTNSTDALGVVETSLSHDEQIRAVLALTTSGGSSRIFQSAPTLVIPNNEKLHRHLDAFLIIWRNLSVDTNIDLA